MGSDALLFSPQYTMENKIWVLTGRGNGTYYRKVANQITWKDWRGNVVVRTLHMGNVYILFYN